MSNKEQPKEQYFDVTITATITKTARVLAASEEEAAATAHGEFTTVCEDGNDEEYDQETRDIRLSANQEPDKVVADVAGEQPKYTEDELYDVRVHHKDTVRLAVAYHQDGVWYEQGTNNELVGRVELEDGSDGVMHKEPENPDDTITDSWHISDVRERDEASDFTDDQCREVLRRVKANLNDEEGINYSVVDFHIDALIEEEAQAARDTSAPAN
jgi:hypothetical protein